MDKFNLIKNGRTVGYIKAKNLTVALILHFVRMGYTIELKSMAG